MPLGMFAPPGACHRNSNRARECGPGYSGDCFGLFRSLARPRTYKFCEQSLAANCPSALVHKYGEVLNVGYCEHKLSNPKALVLNGFPRARE